MKRRLTLKKEALLDLDDAALLRIGAGRLTELSCFGSCYTFYSCDFPRCRLEDTTLCLES